MTCSTIDKLFVDYESMLYIIPRKAPGPSPRLLQSHVWPDVRLAVKAAEEQRRAGTAGLSSSGIYCLGEWDTSNSGPLASTQIHSRPLRSTCRLNNRPPTRCLNGQPGITAGI